MVNKVILVGRLTEDPNTFVGQDPLKSRTVFTLVTEEAYRKGEEMVKEPTYHNIIAWGKVSDIVSNIAKKGYQVYVEGKLRYHTYEKDGEKRQRTQVQIDIFRALSKPMNSKE